MRMHDYVSGITPKLILRLPVRHAVAQCGN